MKHTVLTLLALLLFHPASDASRRKHSRFPEFLTFGIEGSYINTVASSRHYNFISSYGYRIDRKYWDTGYHANGEFLVHIGVNVSDRMNMSLLTGYSGLARFRRMTPLTLRATWYFGEEQMKGKWLAFAEAGPGFAGGMEDMSLYGIWKLGSGYRIPLSRYTRLDFLISARTVMSRRGAFETGVNSSVYVPEENLRRNDALYFALVFGIGLTF